MGRKMTVEKVRLKSSTRVSSCDAILLLLPPWALALVDNHSPPRPPTAYLNKVEWGSKASVKAQKNRNEAQITGEAFSCWLYETFQALT